MNKLMDEILELAKKCSDTSYLNKFFGKHYVAYEEDNKYFMCECDCKSVANKEKIYYKYFVNNKQTMYYDYIYNQYIENPTLKQFLGLPEELDIDYSKNVVSQIQFRETVCDNCNDRECVFFVNKQNKYSQIQKENYLLSRGLMYMPITQDCYFLLDELESWQIEMLIPDISDFQIDDKICNGYQSFIDNPDKEKQKENINKFLSLKNEKIVEIIYGSEKIAKKSDFLYKKCKINPIYLKLENEIPWSTKYQKAINISKIKNITKKFREVCSQTYKQNQGNSLRKKFTLLLEQVVKEGTDFDVLPSNIIVSQSLYDFTKNLLQTNIDIDLTLMYKGDFVRPLLNFVIAFKDLELVEMYINKLDFGDEEYIYYLIDILEDFSEEETDDSISDFCDLFIVQLRSTYARI